MKFTGEHVVEGSPEQVWAALLDPEVLVRTIPGCERLVATGDNTYDMTVTAGVAAIRGSYAGSCRMHTLTPHESLVMDLQGAGAPGTIGATVDVTFTDLGGRTQVGYSADAVVGGMIGGVGQRMLTSVSKRMAGEFFGSVEQAMAGGAPAAGTGAPVSAPAATEVTAGGAVFTAPAASVAAAGRGDFLTGVAVGAGLVSLGVILGAVFGRRR